MQRGFVRQFSNTSSEPIFKAGLGLTFNSRFDIQFNINFGANSSFFDFSSSNFLNSDSLQLKDNLFKRSGSFSSEYLSYFPNIDEKDNVSLWRGNTGIPNTDKGGLLTITTEAVTTIATQNAWVDLAGTFTLTKDQHVDSPSNGQLRNNSDIPVDYKTNAQVLIDGTSGNIIEIRANVFRDSTSTFEPQEIFSDVIDSNLGGTDVARIRMFDSFTLFPSDYVKYEARNTSGTQNFTALQNSSKFKLEER